MKKLLVVLGIVLTVLVLASCEKRTTDDPETTITTEHTTFAPYTDEDGKLNVDVSDHEFE